MNSAGLDKVKIQKDQSVKDAMKQLSLSAWRILFLVNDDEKLIGTLTDGDIRRWILNNGSLDESIARVCRKNPLFIEEDGYDIERVKEIMLSKRIEAIPILDKNGIIRNVLFWEEVFSKRYPRRRKKLALPVVIIFFFKR